MGYTVIAPVGDNIKALFIGMKEFPTERVYLVSPPHNLRKAQKLKKQLEEFTIKVRIIEMKGNIMEETFRIFGELCSLHDENEVIVNVATGDRMSTCAALSA